MIACSRDEISGLPSAQDVTVRRSGRPDARTRETYSSSPVSTTTGIRRNSGLARRHWSSCRPVNPRSFKSGRMRMGSGCLLRRAPLVRSAYERILFFSLILLALADVIQATAQQQGATTGQRVVQKNHGGAAQQQPRRPMSQPSQPQTPPYSSRTAAAWAAASLKRSFRLSSDLAILFPHNTAKRRSLPNGWSTVRDCRALASILDLR